MGNRLSVISTRTGDDGTTGLGDGSRKPKHTLRIVALGEVDELNSVLGLLCAETGMPEAVAHDLNTIQHDLFDMGAELCIPGHTALQAAQVAFLDARLAHYNSDLGPLQEFILPGGCRAAAQAHVARTVCRRAERTLVALHEQEPQGDAPRQYLNRLSDLLFVLARFINRAHGVPDVAWQRHEARKA
ncbi:ATP:Cob(I)alamin adenosyltransferase [plant metagenome]|uniref:ATP:Cob(I)alamin adenosyltransferase n=1 Tax=plant metagenome TaxID=1297885 RepID=A0A484SG98_9ZZZZ